MFSKSKLSNWQYLNIRLALSDNPAKFKMLLILEFYLYLVFIYILFLNLSLSDLFKGRIKSVFASLKNSET